MLYLKFKNLLDFALAFCLILLLSPLLFLTYLAIFLEDQDNPIFCQQRIGKHGKLFYLYKFRSLRVVRKDILYPKFSVASNDNRVTKVGFIIRLLSIDELPQLFNILNGEMSFIGPRPSIEGHPYKSNNYPEHIKERLSVKPGISGLSQVSGRNRLSNDEKYLIDLKYVKNLNLKNDLKIFFKTFITLLDFGGIFE